MKYNKKIIFGYLALLISIVYEDYINQDTKFTGFFARIFFIISNTYIIISGCKNKKEGIKLFVALLYF